VVTAVASLTTAWTAIVLALRAWSSGPHAATSRYALVSATVDAVVVLALVRAVVEPSPPLSWMWVIATVAVGIGVAGAILRWHTLGWTRPGQAQHPRRRAALACGYALVGAALVATLA
jgi:protein-S-isoprenylcysteine O-methyltransferase Ste14